MGKEMTVIDYISLVIIYVALVLGFLFGEPYGIRQSYVVILGIIVTISIIYYITKKS